MILLTVNTGVASFLGTKFKSSYKESNNIYKNTQNVFSNLSGMPVQDTFIKQNNVSFKGSIGCPLVGRPDNGADILLLGDALQEKLDEVWDWMQNNGKYRPYFEKMNIEKPRIAIVQGGKPLTPDRSEEQIATYNWINNTIDVNLSFLPNVAAASKGELSFMAQNITYSIIGVHEPPAEFDQYLEVANKNLRSGIENSARWKDEKYYYKLTPEETAELAGSYLAHELDHVIITHALYNTAGLSNSTDPTKKGGNHAFHSYFERLKQKGDFPKGTSKRWEDSYVCNYRPKKPGEYVYNAEDIWEIDAGNGFKKRIRMKDIPPLMFANPKKHMTNCLDLSGQCTALEYLKTHRPKPIDKRTDDMMNILYDYITRVTEEDVSLRKEKVR